jgi:BMFP domain-containing protein YqiC
MQTRSRMFDDLARLTNGAASVLSGFRDEAEGKVRQQLERLLADMDVVPREEFEAVREMAANARREQEALTQRVAALEAQLAALAEADRPRRASRRRGAAAPAGESAADDESDDTTG